MILQDLCDSLIDDAYNCGIKIVDHIDPEEYNQLLERQKEIVIEQKAELKSAREAKLLRTL